MKNRQAARTRSTHTHNDLKNSYTALQERIENILTVEIKALNSLAGS